jgi:hypothetical protein
MPQPDPRLAAVERDLGMRRIGQLTWRVGLAGVASATVLAVALGHHTPASAATQGHRSPPGGIVIPAQPPQPSGGFGHVTSGAS